MRGFLKRNRGFILFLLLFGFLRTAVADWNPIPSGSMRPTLLEGDVVLVDRLAYDFKVPLTDRIVLSLGSPRRGDVVTFSSPKDGTRLIKRIVAVPGDTVEVRGRVLFINGRAAEYSEAQWVTDSSEASPMPAVLAKESSAGSERGIQFLPTFDASRTIGPVSVPDRHYFVLGDNRDNSLDSRYFGFVPRERLIGRAHHIVVSARITEDWMPRLERFWDTIK